MAKLYLAFGPTHSGKTTFGKKLFERLDSKTKIILVDNDTVEVFLMNNFDKLRTDPDIIRTRTPANPDLRLKIPQLITEYALAEGYSVIVTASHSKEVIRMKYYDMARQCGADVVLLMFQTSKAEVLRRIEKTERQDISLNTVSFGDLFAKQSQLLHEPNEIERDRYDEVYMIDENTTDEVLDALVKSQASGYRSSSDS